MPAPRKYPLELRERAVRMYRTAEPKPVIRRMAEELGVHHEALRNWIRQAEADAGERDDLLTTEEKEVRRRSGGPFPILLGQRTVYERPRRSRTRRSSIIPRGSPLTVSRRSGLE